MRSRTSSEVKWLVNEAAALAGELDRLNAELAEISRKRDEVQKAHDACTKALSCVVGRKATALDLPVVSPHRPYGRRGNLRQFLMETLQQAPETAYSTSQLAALAIAYFGLEIFSEAALYDFKFNSVARGMHRLQVEGLVERIAPSGDAKRTAATWRWKDPLPAFQELIEIGEAKLARPHVAGKKAKGD